MCVCVCLKTHVYLYALHQHSTHVQWPNKLNRHFDSFLFSMLNQVSSSKFHLLCFTFCLCFVCLAFIFFMPFIPRTIKSSIACFWYVLEISSIEFSISPSNYSSELHIVLTLMLIFKIDEAARQD